MTDAPFIPHAIVETEHRIPTSIMQAAIYGVANIMRIDLDGSQPEDTFIEQAIAGLQAKHERWRTDRCHGRLPAFGKPVSLVVNYAADRATRYDLDGNVIEHLNQSVEIGSASATVARGKVKLEVR
ncbi:hypothetical protein [Methylobacterium soli]|uniref:Uncharacterized protein n=1 Tax=Methylobacterium soli TaxID=553447 RepID=A0A6L3SW53_9HYPH|nr:hypothetical protein [Methylobacterium soli]KAB1078062.1 hypothetical protein F6X53_16330 [Methylobacterium soli]GJE42982.1 hypothetical protein AEGHOMDF_2159 [Methylobacterium soli]